MKQIKVLGVIAIALTLGLTACGKKAECKKHTWGDYVTVTEATCTTDGSQKRTCSVCGKEETKVIKAGHKWGEWITDTPSTCKDQGDAHRTCSACGQNETKKLDLADHTYPQDEQGNDIVAWTTEADCTTAGEGTKTCSVCGHEEAVTTSALGHNYHKDAQGNIEFNWTTEPGCENEGVGTKHCDRCGLDIEADADERKALGHDIVAVGGETTPTDGTAAVRLYHCNRCNQTFMGFLANEVTDASKSHVAFEPETVTGDQEQGARFLGRPIGNALALDSTGTSVNQKNGECVYCSTETGDFIEYAFRLNAEQAATLSTCRMYCDAQPANYLNGTDFWAYSGSNDEWTPGFYIDGGDERFETDEDGNFVMVDDHEKAGYDSQPGAAKVDASGNPVKVRQGKRIEDYRYVLYVDDQVVDFDPDTKNPTSGRDQNMQRGEFVLPYTFHLHEGLNKIKFVMAGGYRSLFYKCIFRPYTELDPVTVNESNITLKVEETAQITSSMTGLTYTSDNSSVAKVDATGLVTGVKAGSTKIVVSKEGYRSARVAVKVNEKDGVYQVEAESGVSSKGTDGNDQITFRVPSGGASGSMTDAFPKDATLTLKFDAKAAEKADMAMTLRGVVSDLGEAMSITLNGNPIDLAGKALNSQYSMTKVALGEVDVIANENTIVVTALGDSMPNLDFFRFEPAKEKPADPWVLDSETVMPTPAADEALVKRYVHSEEEGKVKYEIAVKTANITSADSGAFKTDPSTGEFKLNNGKTATFKFALPKPFEGKMYQVSYIDSYNSNKEKKAFYETNNHANIEVKVNNGAALDLSGYATTTFQDLFNDELDGSNSVAKEIELGDVVLKESNTISYKRVETLNMIVKSFVFIGQDHNHTFDYGTDPVPVQKAGECDYVVGQCAADGVKALKISAAADLAGKITARGGKLPKGTSNKYDGTAIASYKFTAPEGFGSKAHLMAVAGIDNAGNYDYSFYTGKDSSGSTKNPMPDGTTNTVVTINGASITMPTATYRQMGCSGVNDETKAGLVDFGEFEVIEGTNEFTLAATNSYGLQYYDFLIVA